MPCLYFTVPFLQSLTLVTSPDSELARVASVLAAASGLKLVIDASADLSRVAITDAEAPTLLTAAGPVQRAGAIVRALARMQPSAGLYGPGDALSAGQVEAWLDFGDLQLRPALTPIVKACAAGHDVSKVAKKMDVLVPLLEALEAKCTVDTWLATQRPTVADYAVAITLDGLFEHVLDEEARAARLGGLFRWWLTVRHQPAALEALGEPVVLGSALADAAPGSSAAGSASAAAAAGGAGFSTVPMAPVHALQPSPALSTAAWGRRRARIVDVLAAGKSLAGQTITVCGWARTTRAAGGSLLFIALSDGSCGTPLQVVVEAGRCPDHAALAAQTSVSAAVTVTGVVVESPAKGQAV